MGKRKMIHGVCRLCGEKKELSFEHIPPKSSYNKSTRYKSIPMMEYMKDIIDPVNQKFKGKTLQGGIGHYSLCRDCNSFLGNNYVDYYKSWVNGGIKNLKCGNYSYYVYDVINIEPLKVIKHVISMFISLNEKWFLESYPELSEFVKNPESKVLPERFQLYLYLNNEGHYRYLPFQIVSINLKVIKCSEITYPPYGYVLTFDYDDETNILNNLYNITYFKDYSWGEEVNLELIKVYRLPTYYLFPLDYRTKEQVKKHI